MYLKSEIAKDSKSQSSNDNYQGIHGSHNTLLITYIRLTNYTPQA